MLHHFHCYLRYKISNYLSKSKLKDDPFGWESEKNKRLPTQEELEEYCDDEEDLKTYFIDKTQRYGQCYEEHVAFGVKCPTCGSKKFNVGYGSCFTICTCAICKNLVHWHVG